MDIPPLIKKLLSMDRRRKFLWLLINYDGVSPFFMSDLERYSGWDDKQKDIRKVIHCLIDMGIITKVEKIKKDWTFKLNKKKLANLLRESDVFLTNGKLIEATTLVRNY